MCLFQIAEERISLGYVLVDMGFIVLCRTFTVINSSFLTFETALELVKLRFTMIYIRFCPYDLILQLPYLLFNSFDKLLVAECFKCLKRLSFRV